METNHTTLSTYQENFDKYVSGTPSEVSGTQKDWIESVLARINMDARILEIGSAFGRDAAFMQRAGYANVTVTDAFDAAVDALQEQGFAKVKKFNALTDELEDEYDLIFASAVFLHFTEREFRLTLDKLRGNLGKSGLLAFTVKQGEGEEWSSEKMDAPRFFHYWQKETLGETVQSRGYKVVEIAMNEEFSQKWLAVTCTPETSQA